MVYIHDFNGDEPFELIDVILRSITHDQFLYATPLIRRFFHAFAASLNVSLQRFEKRSFQYWVVTRLLLHCSSTQLTSMISNIKKHKYNPSDSSLANNELHCTYLDYI
ncbi:hypothetical protein GQX74_000121 [Glossina fuscipes]|nr:hypothetical protein GQX74_000121 [Glossina fuscipes]